MTAFADRIREYKAANPTLSNAEIGRRLGVTRHRVWRALNQDRVRIDNLARRSYKREWDNARDRSEAGRGRCEECSEPMGIGSARQQYKVCADCKRAAIHRRRQRVVDLWKQGRPIRDIAAELGFTVGHMSVELNNMRKAGYDLPHRHRPPRKRAAA